MADAKMVFSNIANIHEFDDISYLSEEQKDILKSFFGNFSDDHNSKLKELFLSLWNKLGDIYAGFRERLSKQHIAYEGMLYRNVVDEQTIKVEYDKYIFVGFNVLQRVEQHLFSFLKSEGMAEFYWDYDFHYVSRNNGNIPNEAGKYISQYIKTLGDSLSEELRGEAYDNFRKQKDISFVKAKTENIQARYVSSWLKENERYKDGKRTAIVMCAENLLQAIVHSIPDCVENVNVTTGYPLSQTPVASFVSQLLDMRIIGTRDDGGFRISFIRKVLSHPFATHLSEKSQELLQKYQLAAKEAHESLTDEIKDKLAKVEAKSKSKTEQIASLVRMIFTQKRERVVFSKEERETIYDNALNGIIVQFDLTFSQKAWTELQRYHFFDFVSSCSTMHKLQNMNPRQQCNRYVDPRAIDVLNEKIAEYNRLLNVRKEGIAVSDDTLKEARLEMLYNIPSGFELTAAMTTNYRQLKTVYQQRRHHALPDWQMFCDFCETLPRFLELTQRGYKPNED